MTKSKSFIVIEFKYPDRPWQEFDRTKVPEWADVQLMRMKSEYPNAQYRRIKK